MSDEIIKTIILGAIGSIIGAIIIFLVLKFVKSIPTYKRKYMVSLYIETIQGYTDIYISKSLTYLFSIFPILLFVISTVLLFYFDTKLVSIENKYNTTMTYQDSNSPKKEEMKDIKHLNLNEDKKTIGNLRDELKKNFSKLKVILNNLQNTFIFIIVISILWIYWLLIYRFQHNRERAKFTFEYKRLRELLFVLILKKEDRIKLFNKEVQVVDEKTLKEYTTLLIQYAEDNKINGVKERMWIWDEKIDLKP